MKSFIDAKNAEIIANYTGTTRKWMTIGGSYPGAMSAWFKHTYPTSAVASWSSSGVINPIRNFYDFDLDIFEATSRSGPECPAAINNITNYIEEAI